jgi:hypothetical protein
MINGNKKKRPQKPGMVMQWVIYGCGCCQPDGYDICPNPDCKNPKPPKKPRQICKKP